MKIRIMKSVLSEAVKSVQNVVPSKVNVTVLQNVLFSAKGNELCLTTTDVEMSICTTVECEVLEEGSSTLPVKLLAPSISRMNEGKIEVETDENDVANITSGSTNFKISGISSKLFPTLPSVDETNVYEMESQTLKEMLRKTYYAAAQDDSRRTLKGIMIEFNNQKMTVVAADGRRLALVEKEMEVSAGMERQIVLPAKTVQELMRLINGNEKAKICVQDTQICIEIGKVKIYSKLMEEKFPNFTQVIPTNNNEIVVVDRQMLLDSIERVSVMTMDETHSVKMVFDSNVLTVMSVVSDVGSAKDEVPIKYIGEKIEISFNPNYLMEPLKAIDDDEVRIELKDGHSPAVIKCSIPFLYVLMPLRIS